jgi:HSP20 family molecular chaperone IbpA
MMQQQFDPSSMFRFAPQQQQQQRTRRLGDIDLALPWSMDMDVMDGDTEYIILCELPGVNKDKVEVKIENNILMIKATKERW